MQPGAITCALSPQVLVYPHWKVDYVGRDLRTGRVRVLRDRAYEANQQSRGEKDCNSHLALTSIRLRGLRLLQLERLKCGAATAASASRSRGELMLEEVELGSERRASIARTSVSLGICQSGAL